MSQTARIGILGAGGRMGRTLIQAVQQAGGVLAAAVEQPNSSLIGTDAGEMAGVGHLGVTVVGDLAAVITECDVVIDFTAPAATVEYAGLAAQARAVHVIGTTGLEPVHFAKIDAAARHAVIVQTGNMSLGVNLLVRLTQKVAQALDADWDIEVVEAHHRMKVDAPSGTALMLGQAAADGRGIALTEAMVSGRDGITGARKPGSIGFSAIRGGDIVGEHDVLFASPGERIVLRHVATDRAIFARGALKAALWGQDKAPGAYDMLDVLGL